MKKSFITMGLVVALSAASAMPAFAGWEQSGTIWKYKDDSAGIYLTGWQWLDGNHDGIYESYFLDSNGVMASNSVIEGYTVNEQGQWTINGVVQTKPATQPTQPAPVEQPAPQPEVTQPAPQPEVTQSAPENNNVSGGIDTSGWDLGGGVTVEPGTPLSDDQHLSPEQEKAINEIQFN